MNATRILVILTILAGMIAATACHRSPQAKEARYLKNGQAQMAQKDYARAALEFRNAAQVMPNDAEPYYQLGLAYLQLQNILGAAGAFRKATELDPKHEGAQIKLSEIMLATRNKGLLEDAAGRLQGLLKTNSPEVIDRLAVAEWKLGKTEEASKRLEEALQNFPSHLDSSVALARMKLLKKDLPGAEEVLRKAVAADPKSSLAALALGQLLLLRKQPGQAEAEIQRSLQLDPQNVSALFSLASIQIAGKRMDEAEETYKRLAALPEKSYKPLHAIFLYQTGKHDAALGELEKLAKSDPDNRNVRSLLVAAYFTAKRLSEAEGILGVALNRNARDTDALLQRSDLYLKSGRPLDAEKDLKMVLHFKPDSAEANFALSRVYQAQGMFKSEQEKLNKALQLDSRLVSARVALAHSYLGERQPKSALDVIDQAPEDQKKLASLMIERNWALMFLGNREELKAGVNQILQEGREPAAVLQDALLKLEERNYAGAQQTAEELLKQNPGNVLAATVLAEVYARQKQLSKAIERLKELAAAQPKSAALQQLLGQWYARAGNFVDARKSFEKAKAADPHFVLADLSLAEADIRENSNAAALERLGKVLTAAPNNLSARLLSAQAEDATGAHAAAISSYRDILNIDSTNVIALNNLAYLLAAENSDEALKFAQQAAELDPGNAGIQDTLGWIYYRKGLYSMAVRYLKTAVDKESNPRREFHLGMSYLKVGEQATGQKFVREALQKDPNLAKTEQGW